MTQYNPLMVKKLSIV